LKAILQFNLIPHWLYFTFLALSLLGKAKDSSDTLVSASQHIIEDASHFQQMAASIKPSIVVIESVDRVGREGGRGTGFVVSKNGLIATNFHVIGEHREFIVRFANGESYRPTSIVGIDRARDLALFTIDADHLTPLTLGDSSSLTLGETIISLGNPLGYDFSVSRGVIAAIRELEFGDGRPMIQVAVPIEPGSSGSPVINLKEEVVSILSIKSGGAMGFGVPVNALKNLIGEKTTSIPIDKWLTIGTLDERQWKVMMNGSWKQRAGEMRATGLGNGFGGRMVCINQKGPILAPFELEVEVKLDDESGAAGLVFCANETGSHYGFYPTNGSLRLTHFVGPSVYSWNILKTTESQAYLSGEWNLLHVKLEENGRILCSVNKKIVIDVLNFEKTSGMVGLCKFRAPTASFRNFRFGQRFSSQEISLESRKKIRQLTKELPLAAQLKEKSVQEILEIGAVAPQILKDFSKELRQKSTMLEILAEEVREKLVIAELVETLNYEDEKSIDLLKSALLIARLDNEHFDLGDYLHKADLLAHDIGKSFPEGASNPQRIKILAQQLFQEMGFHGSTLDYNHRSNSYINEVMDDREGLPITLSVLFIELANRLNLNVSGLGIPGHFLALYQEPINNEETPETERGKPAEIIIDSFGGEIINRKQAAKLSGRKLNELEFKPSEKKDIIKRILRNLVQSAENENDTKSQIRYLDTILAIGPEDRYSRAQRAMLFYISGKVNKSLTDIEFLLENYPDSPENQPLRVIRNRLIDQGANAF
jgi:serine protease Do